MLVTNRARAYVNWGRWVADCTRPYCNSAAKLDPGQPVFYCAECRQIADIDWPTDAEEIWSELERRPVPGTRNWFPAGHELALRSGRPHGQTVAELRAETLEHQEA